MLGTDGKVQHMARYIVNRLLISIPIFFGITIIVFALFALSPGDPVINIIGFASYVEMTPDQVEAGSCPIWT